MLSRTFAIRLDTYFKNEIITSRTFASTTKNYLSLKQYIPIFDATVFFAHGDPSTRIAFSAISTQKITTNLLKQVKISPL